ncbi:MAG TPA: PaaI family thioesterase [Acetobacteraceae bacterium]|jgi:uncharacterized protein (TIGR00369 family)|nr:PaaI family thioesterase [Acetobacteraceae bacterium]
MSGTTGWTLAHIQQHIAAGLPLAQLFNMAVVEATPARARLRLNEGAHVTRPGGSVAGPVLFALADVVTYALILAARHDPDAVTVDLTINFLRAARVLPLLAEAVPLRGGRRLFTAEVRISEADGAGAMVAQATTTWSLAKREA